MGRGDTTSNPVSNPPRTAYCERHVNGTISVIRSIFLLEASHGEKKRILAAQLGAYWVIIESEEAAVEKLRAYMAGAWVR